MKMNLKLRLIALPVVFIMLVSSCNTDKTVSGFAEMGQKVPGAAPGAVLCDGMGFCSVNDNQAVDGNAIPVIFKINTGNMNKISISYSMSALREKQLNNARYASASGTYSFPAAYQLPPFVTSALGLPASSNIPAGAGTITVNGDDVVINMPLAH